MKLELGLVDVKLTKFILTYCCQVDRCSEMLDVRGVKIPKIIRDLKVKRTI